MIPDEQVVETNVPCAINEPEAKLENDMIFEQLRQLIPPGTDITPETVALYQ